METYHTWLRLFELLRFYSWIVDRFHISTRVYQRRTHEKDLDFHWLEARLSSLGFHVVLCVRSPESFSTARTERVKVSGNPSQYDDLGVFVSEQEMMRRIVGESILPTMELDVSDDDVNGGADRIARWLENTGGLHWRGTSS